MRAKLSCRCGEVRGEVEATPQLSQRVTCYCDDCQAFAHYLERPDLLDAKGGSDIVAIPPAGITFTKGQDRIDAVRFSPKGLYRWRARCCGTPLGNVANPAIPFVGMAVTVFRVEGQDPDRLFGKPRGAIMGQFAIGGAPPGTKGVSLRLMLPLIAGLLRWRLAGRGWPHPFFDRASKTPTYPVTVLSKDVRERLRAP